MSYQNQSERFHITLESEVKCEKIGEVAEVSGVILTEGTFTDREGKTFHYTMDVLEKAKDSFVGVPLVYPHTEEKEGPAETLSKVGGFSTETWINGKELWYKGIAYKPELVQKAATKKLHSHSIEAGVDAIYNDQLNVNEVQSLLGEAICLTDRPACATCQAKSVKVTSTVKLEEERGRGQALPPSGTQVCESETCDLMERLTIPLFPRTRSQKQYGERVKMSFEDEHEEEEEEPQSPEEALEKIRSLATEYPAAKKAWGEMSDAEKTSACKMHFKKTGYPEPEKTKQEGPSVKGFAFAMKKAGVPMPLIQKALKLLKEKYPGPAKTKKEDFSVESIFEETDELKEMRERAEKAESDLGEVRKEKAEAELKELVKGITETMPSFDEKVFFEGVDCVNEKIKMSKRLKVQLEKMKQPASVRAVSDVSVDKVNRISMEEFGSTPEELLKSLVPEAFKEEK